MSFDTPKTEFLQVVKRQDKSFRQDNYRYTLATLLSILLTPVANANVVGGETQNFNPTTNGAGFITVQSSETLPQWTLNIGGFLNHAVNTLPVFEQVDGEQSRSVVNDTVTGFEVHAGYGVMKNWDLGISIPNVIAQSIDSEDDFRGEFSATGMTSIGINSKYRVWNNSKMGVAIIGSANFNQLQDNPYVGEGGGPTFNIEVAGDYKVGKNLFAINLGHRFRSPGTEYDSTGPVRPLKNQFIWSGAGSFAVDSSKYIVAELFGSVPTQDAPDDSDRLESSAEGILGYRHLVHKKQVALNAGLGTELVHGHSSPDWRLFAGVNWTFKVKKRKVEVVPEPIEPEKFIEGPLGPIKPTEIITVHDILFAFNSDRLILRGQNTSVFKLKKQLDAGPGFKRLVIVGHTDSIGSAKYNRGLSKRRAMTLRNWLIKNYNIEPGKITAIGIGEAEPISTNKTDKGRQQNRRVEFKIFR